MLPEITRFQKFLSTKVVQFIFESDSVAINLQNNVVQYSSCVNHWIYSLFLNDYSCCGWRLYNINTLNVKINENNVNENLNKANSIESFYADTGILVTGATGFVGKGILEKLMRVCLRIAAIFILIRPKKNQTIEQRFKKLMDDPVRK